MIVNKLEMVISFLLHFDYPYNKFLRYKPKKPDIIWSCPNKLYHCYDLIIFLI